MGLRDDDALVPGDQMRIERRRGALADEPFGVRDARHGRSGAIEDADGPVRGRPLLRDDLGKALERIVQREIVEHAPVLDDRDVGADHGLLEHAADEEIGDRRPGGLEHAPDDRRVAAHRQRLPLRPRGVQELLAVGVGDDDRCAGRQGLEEPLRLLAKAGQIAGPQGPRDGKPLEPGDRRLQLALDHERHAARDLERALGAAGAVVAIVQVRVGRREGDHRQHADDDE